MLPGRSGLEVLHLSHPRRGGGGGGYGVADSVGGRFIDGGGGSRGDI